ncbi:dihydroneopterin aldolase [Legionella impletisoli]|uniref:7,8-dihydroneopterin aldolase n=1 Tax=Legionella impletisoli TaxID=343510 RepID=A0A917JWI1_9GAMM|nr:dihydroneopterin aldolase [Legionella impletisoli]GGI89584.1 7,8-dihydroneopterin aldolase [Legionella impletisoli]
MDKLEINALSITTHIGVHAWEQKILQQVLIDLSFPIDCASVHDELKNTIDYDQVCQRITDFVESNSFQLIETVAEKVAQLVKNEFKVTQLSIRVSKPSAIKNAANVSVHLER